MKQVCKHWFLISLIVLMAIGFWFAIPLEPITKIEWLKWSIVPLAMFFMSWPLSFGRLKQTASRPGAAILGCLLNLILIPLLIWPLAMFAGTELGPGMIIAAATPSTLASGAVLTRRAGGDESVAMLVTIITNASCFLVMPFWVMVQTGNEIESSKLIGTIYKLLFFVVLPIAVAQLARIHKPSAKWATVNKPLLSVLALIGVLGMVFLGAIGMGLRFAGDDATNIEAWQLIYTAVTLLAVHLVVFVVGIILARQMGRTQSEQIAVGFSGSQKTLMIGLSTAVNLGMSMIPIVLYHALQLIADAVIAEKIRDRQTSTETVQNTAAVAATAND